MSSSVQFFNPSEASRRLGVSAKALRLYEQHGLITPQRTDAGWRTYGPNDMARAAEIAALRQLGLSLGQIARMVEGDAENLEPALAAHEAMLEGRLRHMAGTIEKVRRLRVDLGHGKRPQPGELARLLRPKSRQAVAGLTTAFDLPWPWGGEPFELRDIRSLNYIVGPLGSGKTRLAKRIAEMLPDAAFLGLERLASGAAAISAQLQEDPALSARVDQALAWMTDDGAIVSDALVALLTGLEADKPKVLVVDMLEQGLDQATQQAFIAHLRRRGPDARPLFVLTRSNAILDLETVGINEAIILCPANHSPPMRVSPYPGSPGYEAVATCLASPEVRARTEGVIAVRPKAA